MIGFFFQHKTSWHFLPNNKNLKQLKETVIKIAINELNYSFFSNKLIDANQLELFEFNQIGPKS